MSKHDTVKKGLKKRSKKSTILSGISLVYRDYFFVSQKVASKTSKEFAVLNPDHFMDFVRDIAHDDKLDMRTRILIITMASGALRKSEALELKKAAFMLDEHEGEQILKVRSRVLKKRIQASYRELIENYLDSDKVNQGLERKAKRRDSVEKSLGIWLSSVEKGYSLLSDAIDSEDESTKKLASKVLKLKGHKADPERVIGSEFTLRWEAFLGYLGDDPKVSKTVVKDIKALKDHYDSIKYTGELYSVEREFDIICDREGVIYDLFYSYLANFRDIDHIFVSERELSLPRKERKRKPLDKSSADLLLKKALGENITTHAFRHSVITYLLKNGRTKTEIAKIFNITESVIDRYANVWDSQKRIFPKI